MVLAAVAAVTVAVAMLPWKWQRVLAAGCRAPPVIGETIAARRWPQATAVGAAACRPHAAARLLVLLLQLLASSAGGISCS
jgi:hypothetical protein